MRRIALLMFMFVSLSFLGYSALAEAPIAPQLDLDTLDAVVPISVDGKYAGAGVVVTSDGKVITAIDLGLSALKQRVTIRDLLGNDRAVVLINFDDRLGVALLQMHGQIPIASKLSAKKRAAHDRDAAICKFDDRGKPVACNYAQLMLDSQDSLTPPTEGASSTVPNGGVWPIYDSKTREIKALFSVRQGKDGTRFASVTPASALRKLLQD